MKKMMIMLALLASGLSYAHDDAMMAAMKAPNGGELKMVGWYHIEFVSKKNEASIYLSDHAGAIKPSKGSKATLSVVGDKPQTIVLKPLEPNQLKGQLKSPLQPGQQVNIVLTLADGRSEQVSYTVPAAKHH